MQQMLMLWILPILSIIASVLFATSCSSQKISSAVDETPPAAQVQIAS